MDCDSQQTVFWVRVPSVSQSKIIYIYYGHPRAFSSSAGEDTFDFFDDFEGNVLDSSKWFGNPTVEVSSGYVHLARPVDGGTSIRMKGPPITTGAVHWKGRRGKGETGQGPGVFLSYSENAMEGGVFQGVDYKAGKWGLMIFKPNTDWSYGGDIDSGEHVLRIAYAPGIVHYAYIDSSLIDADKHITNASFTSLQLGAGEGQRRADSYFDWVFIRKYSDPEPDVNVGAEVDVPAAANSLVASSTTLPVTTTLMTTTFPSTTRAVKIPETTLMTANPVSITSVPIEVTAPNIQETASPEASSTTLAADNLSAEFEAWKKNQSASSQSVNETPKDNSLVMIVVFFILLALLYLLLSGFYKKKQSRSWVINQCQESAQRIESLKTLKATVMKEFHTRKLTEEDARKMILECEKDMILERSKLGSLVRKLGIRSDDVSGREEVIGWIIEKLSSGEKPSLMKKEMKEQGIDPKLADIVRKAIK